jgi:hypothetical protein
MRRFCMISPSPKPENEAKASCQLVLVMKNQILPKTQALQHEKMQKTGENASESEDEWGDDYAVVRQDSNGSFHELSPPP